MKKIRKIWNENRVLMVLAIVLIICFTTLFLVALTYFYGSNSSEYGNRLDGIEEVKITEKRDNELESKVKEIDSVDKVDLINKGKMIYLSIEFAPGTSMDNAKKIASSTLEIFSEKELKFYDINYTIKATGDNGYTLMGAHNSGSNGTIVWNNNTIDTESETE